MTYRPLGESGLLVSAVGIGCNAFSRRVDQDGVADIIAAARDTGVTLLDTADVYGVTLGASEEMLGIALEGQRDEFVVATKFGGGRQPDGRARASRSTIAAAVEGSLRRLRTDHIDLYQLHVPDDVTPIEETLSALTDLVRAGKVRYVGYSNWSAWRAATALQMQKERAWAQFNSGQMYYSLVGRDVEHEIGPFMRATGLGLTVWSPLAGGFLSGKYTRKISAKATIGSRDSIFSHSTKSWAFKLSRKFARSPTNATPAWCKSLRRGCFRRPSSPVSFSAQASSVNWKTIWAPST